MINQDKHSRGYDGNQHIQNFLADSISRRIYFELLRDLLRDRCQDLQEMTHWIPVELVFKALVIREFMERHGIEDVRDGIREFYAFQREQIRKLRYSAGIKRRS